MPEPQPSLRVGLKRSFSGLLWNTLQEQYEKIGFGRLKDEAFKALCLAKIVEPTSKIDIPLGLQSFERNNAETKTMLPIIQDFLVQNGLTKTTIVADAAMMSAPNLAALAEAGYTYIVGSRLHKVPYDIAEYQKTGELNDQ